MSVSSIKNSITAHKGQFTRCENAVERLVKQLKESPTPMTVRLLEDAHSKLSRQFDQIEEKYVRCQEIDPSNFDSYNTSVDEITNKYNNITLTVVTAIANAKTVPAPPNSAPPTQNRNNPKVRVNAALKPDTLTKDNNPTELRSWVTKYRSYYLTSSMDSQSIPDQQAYLFICLETYLETKVKGKTPQLLLSSQPNRRMSHARDTLKMSS